MPTRVEKVAESLPVQTVATVIAALAGGPLAAMLPVLATSLASGRQKIRVETSLSEISQILESHEVALRDLTDAQYKLINEAILASLQTTQAEKLSLLRNAVRQSLDMSDIEPQEAILLSRIIRDISAEEVKFVVKNFSYDGVVLAESDMGEKTILSVPANSRDALLVGGLLSLGVLTPGQPTLGQILRFSGIVAKLIVILRDTDD
ncbi:MAG: hypothetical protein V1782_04510 [Pseudomonadota bacterium]